MARRDLSPFETLTSEHDKLHGLLAKTDKSIATTTSEPLMRRLAPLLEDLKTHCDAHMRLEERDGYLPYVRRRLPGRALAVDKLLAEHEVMLSELTEIAAAARAPGAQTNAAEISSRLRAWLTQIREHETHEMSLIQEAWLDDLGQGD